MANLTTVQICPAQEVEGIDECSENIPPGVIAVPGTSTLKDQDGDVSGCSSAHQSGENDPHYAFSTPAPTSQNSKMGLSGFHSALTPVLKQLNIQNKYSSSPSHGITNSWSITRSNQPSDTDIAGACSRRFLGDVNAPVCWLTDECLPEVSFLDVTCDTTLQLSKNNSALPDSMPSPPVTTGFVHTVNTPKTFISKKPDVIHCGISKKPVSVYKGKQTREGTVSETSSNKHQTPQHNHTSKLFNVTEEHSQVAGEIVSGKGNMVVDVPESIDAPLRWLDDRYFPEITLLDVTHDSEFSPKAEIPSLEVMQDIPVSGVQSDLPSSALDRKVEAEPGTQNTDDAKELLSMLDANVIDTTRSLCEQSDKCVPKSTPNISFEVTRDISMKSALEDSQPSLVSSGQCVAKIQTSLEGMPGVHPVNVTRDISSSGDMSVSCAASHTAECNSGSQNTTSEALFDLGATSANVTGNSQELLKSQLTSKLSEDSPKPTRSVNGTFTVAPQSNQNTPSPVNTTAEILGPQNKTLDLPPLIGCSSKAQKDVNGQPGMESQNTNKSSLVSVNNTSCGVPIDTQNTTFEKLQKSTGSAISGEDGANNSSQNNTFTVKLSGENGTITMSETSSSDSQRSALDGPSPQKIYNSAKSPKQGCVETPPPVTNKQYETAVALSDTRTLNNHETESNLAVEVAFTDAQLETKDHSNSSLPMKDGSFDPSGHHSLETDERKDNTFNLDDTLDLRGHSLITSTPMVTLKMFNFSTEREEGKSVMAAQKKLYKDSPSQSNHPVQAEVPSNTAAKSLLPSLKTTSQLLRYKPASTLPGCPEPSVSGLPVTRQKRQAAALRNTGPPQVTTGKPVPYNLHPTTGSRQSTGLPHPRLSSVQTGIHRAYQGLRLPLARSNTAASWSTDNFRGPTVTNPATKISQAKKQPFTRGEPLPTAKRKKMDASLQLEASTSSCDASNRAKILKPPTAASKLLPAKATRVDSTIPASNTEASLSSSSSGNAVSRVRALKQHVATHKAVLPKPQIQSCVRCAALQLQLHSKEEEIRRLKDELMKYSQPHEEC